MWLGMFHSEAEVQRGKEEGWEQGGWKESEAGAKRAPCGLFASAPCDSSKSFQLSPRNMRPVHSKSTAAGLLPANTSTAPCTQFGS